MIIIIAIVISFTIVFLDLYNRPMKAVIWGLNNLKFVSFYKQKGRENNIFQFRIASSYET